MEAAHRAALRESRRADALEKRVAFLRRSLATIAGMDYRGPRPREQTYAQASLQADIDVAATP